MPADYFDTFIVERATHIDDPTQHAEGDWTILPGGTNPPNLWHTIQVNGRTNYYIVDTASVTAPGFDYRGRLLKHNGGQVIVPIQSVIPASVPGTCNFVIVPAGVNSGSGVINGIAVDSLGNIIVIGQFNGTLDFGDGNRTAVGYNIVVAKYRPDQTLMWAKTIGDISDDIGYGVAIDSSDNIIATGLYISTTGHQVNFDGTLLPVGSGQDIFVAKWTPSGILTWVKHFGGAGNDQGIKVAVDRNDSDSIVLLSRFQSAIDFGGASSPLTGAGGTSMAITKLSAAGTTLWAKGYGGSASVAATGIAVDGSGNVWATGYGFGTVNVGGSDGAPGGNPVLFFAKYSGTSGNHLWSVIDGVSGESYGNCVTIDPSTGNAVFSGGTAGAGFVIGAGIFLVNYNSTGVKQWATSYGGGTNAASGIGIKNGKLIITGQATGPIDWKNLGAPANGTGYFITRFTLALGGPVYDPTANNDWNHRASYSGNGQGLGVAFDANGHVFTCGWFEFTEDFGGISKTALSTAFPYITARYVV